jgi:hypothetical protein
MPAIEPRPKRGDVADAQADRRDRLHRQQDKRGRAGEAMHHADRQGAHRPALRMRMAMRRSGVRAFAAVAVRMDMREAQSVAVDMEVGAVAHQPAQHVGAEQHQHDPDGRLQRLPEARGNRLAQPEHDAAEEHQRQGVADAPGHALAQGLRQRALPRRQGGDGGEVVHLGSVLHAEEQADDQDRERGHPAPRHPGADAHGRRRPCSRASAMQASSTRGSPT